MVNRRGIIISIVILKPGDVILTLTFRIEFKFVLEINPKSYMLLLSPIDNWRPPSRISVSAEDGTHSIYSPSLHCGGDAVW